jgi:hypothetical protein
MSTRGERDFEVLEALVATAFRPEIERRTAEPATCPIPAGPTPSRTAVCCRSGPSCLRCGCRESVNVAMILILSGDVAGMARAGGAPRVR